MHYVEIVPPSRTQEGDKKDRGYLHGDGLKWRNNSTVSNWIVEVEDGSSRDGTYLQLVTERILSSSDSALVLPSTPISA